MPEPPDFDRVRKPGFAPGTAWAVVALGVAWLLYIVAELLRWNAHPAGP